MKPYYQLSGEEVLREVNGSEEPLTKEQVSENQKKYGPNELTEGKKKTTVQIFLEQYKDFLVIILIIAAIASGFMGDIESAAVIVIVITMNAILGTVQTVKAEASLASLKKLSGPEAKVLRDGVVVPIPSAEVTVGDIIMLEAGDYIPADGRILECASMKVDESALTGESLGVEKTTDVIEQDEVPLGDRINMVYSGSFLTYGRGSFVVTEIGMNTEVGKIASLLKTTSEKKTPLQVNLDQFGQKLSILILVFCAILFGISVFRGENIGNAFLFAVALAVAAIPEALSSIVTIVLSFGTQKMAKEHAIVRKLQAVEGLGSVSIICSDKTGTLTQNKMTVEHYYVDGQSVSTDKIDLQNPSQSRLLISSILCNDSTNIDGVEIGDPTETALINLGSNLGLDPEEVRVKYPRESENPFDSDRKMMATKHSLNGVPTMIVKGAVDVGQGDCIFIRDKEGKKMLVDGGSSDLSSVGTYRIEPFLLSQGVRKLEYVFVTHGDADHINGIQELLQNQKQGVEIDTLVLPPEEYIDEKLLHLAEIAKENETRVLTIYAGEKVGTYLKCIAPLTTRKNERIRGKEEEMPRLEAGNEASVVLELKDGAFQMLLTGDLEGRGEEQLVESGTLESCPILKAGHHGSKNSGSEEFLQIVKPGLTLISAGIENRYGHPHEETLERLQEIGSEVLSTQECGAITLKSDGRKIKVHKYL